MIPSSRALSTARVRSRTPSLERMLEVWFLNRGRPVAVGFLPKVSQARIASDS